MDIKIGFSDSPRELVISMSEDQESVVAQIQQALEQESGVLQLTDARGRRYFVRHAQIAYVEVGASHPQAVGFAGAS